MSFVSKLLKKVSRQGSPLQEIESGTYRGMVIRPRSSHVYLIAFRHNEKHKPGEEGVFYNLPVTMFKGPVPEQGWITFNVASDRIKVAEKQLRIIS